MNTYNDNLLDAVKGTLSTIANEQAQRESEQTVAQYNLYYAVGAQLLAQDKLDKTNVEYDKTLAINDQGVSNTNQASDLMDYAQTTDQNVTAVVTNTATLAQNVQAASNAILKLASNIGSAKNLVSASDYDTDLQRMTGFANEIINKTAYQAELASQLAMEASTTASQIISKQVLLDVTSTKALFDDMGKRTQTALTSLTDARIADTNKLIAANIAQQSAEGNLKKTAQQCDATQEAYAISNSDLNFSLNVAAVSCDQINVSFDPLEHPFSSNPGKNGTQYYVTVVKAAIKDSFSFDIAEGFFNEYKNERFLPLKPGQNTPVLLETVGIDSQIQSLAEALNGLDAEQKQAFSIAINKILGSGIAPELFADTENFKVQLLDSIVQHYPKQPDNLGAFLNEVRNEILEEQEIYPLESYHDQRLHMDSDGDKIQTGTSYVVFLYIVPDNDYKKEINKFVDRMSASSNAFTLTTQLKAVDSVTYEYTGEPDPNDNPANKPWGVLKFEIETQPNAEYRCIFVPSWSTSQDTCVGVSEAPVKIWFNSAMAAQISETNYICATLAAEQPGQPDKQSYEVHLDAGTTNNFGHLIAQDATYIPVILSIIPESKVEAASFVPALSSLDAQPIELLKPEQSGAIQINTAGTPAEPETAPAEQTPEQSAPATEAAAPAAAEPAAKPAEPEPAPAAQAPEQPAPAATEPARPERGAPQIGEKK